MKTPDETKKGLECCRNLWDCKNKDCPYLGDGCYPKLHEDFKARMEQLEADVENLRKIGENLSARNEELHGKLIDLEAERDAAVREFARKDCVQCKWHGTESKDRPCLKCYDNEYWHWRGVQKEESDA